MIERRTRNLPRVCRALAAAVAMAVGGTADAQLRVVSLNGANASSANAGPRAGMDLILADIGARPSDDPTTAGTPGIVARPSVIFLQEVYTAATTSAQYASLLNSLYPGANYQYSALNGGTTGGGTQGVVYDASAVQLVGATALGTPSLAGIPRQVLRYQLRPIGYDASADVYVYNAHMKSSSDTTSRDRRLQEATLIRADADALPDGANVMYVGDFNVYNSNEAAYQALLGAGNGQAFDPINRPGWSQNNASRVVHTQSPWNLAYGGGFTSGGMDDRFDFQLISGEMVDGRGLSYIAGTYQAWGNNGTHVLNSSIDTGTGASPAVLQAMASILDHLPIVADYRLPAKLGVTVSAAPPRAIVGSTAGMTVSVANAAPVAYAIGADTLDYAFSAAGAASATPATVIDKPALATPDTYGVTLDTATLGPKSGTLSATSTSQQVGTGTFAQAINYTVVEHSNGSFSASADVDAASLDFGYVPLSLGLRAMPFTVANLQAPSGYTAHLTIPSVTVAGSDRFWHAIPPTAGIAGGSQGILNATVNPTATGDLAGTLTLHAADEAIPGAAANATPLTLSVTARVIDSATFPQTGFIRIASGETYATGPFSIAAGVTLTKTGPGAMHVTGAQANGVGSSLVVAAGAVTLSTDAGSAAARTLSIATANAGSVVHLDSTQHLASLSIGDQTTVAFTPGGDKVLFTDALSLASAGRLDLADNDAVLPLPADAVRAALFSARAGGAWTGAGITSFAAAADSYQVTAIGYAPASLFGAAYGGEPVDPASTILKYTWYGDANLDGRVTSDDYALLDRGLAANLTGWTFGDFDYSGVVDQADHLLLDTAFGRQAGVLSPALLADRAARYGDGYVAHLVAVVPEPASIWVAVVGAALIMRRTNARARHCDDDGREK